MENVSAGIFHETFGHGDPVFFLNGIMMTTTSWAQQRRELAQHFRCIFHDFRGQLRSEKPPGPYSTAMHVDDLLLLMNEMQIDRAHLVGTSYGGEIGMIFATAHPERVRSLSVIACVGAVDDELRRVVGEWAAMASENPAGLWDLAMPWNYSPDFLEANPLFVEAARQRFATFQPEWFRALVELCRAFTEMVPNPSGVSCPTLVIAAELDRLKPLAYSRAIASTIRRARLEVIAGAGHAVVIEKPREVNALLGDFLASDAARR